MSLGPMELALLLGLAVLLFGPSRLPGLGKAMGEAIRGFKKGMDGEDDKPTPEQITEASTDKTKQTEKTNEKDKV